MIYKPVISVLALLVCPSFHQLVLEGNVSGFLDSECEVCGLWMWDSVDWLGSETLSSYPYRSFKSSSKVNDTYSNKMIPYGCAVFLGASSSSLARQPLVGPGLLKKLCPFVSVDGVVTPTPNPQRSWRTNVFCRGCLP